MKKFLMLFTILFMSLAFIPVTYAEESATDNLFLEMNDWTVYSSLGRNYIQSDYKKLTYDHLRIEIGTTISLYEEELFNTGTFSQVFIYNADSELLYAIPLLYESPAATSVMYAWDTVNAEPFDLGVYKNLWFRVRVQFTDEATSYQRSQVSWIINQDYKQDILSFNIDVTNEVTPVNELAALPITTGTPFEESHTLLPDEEDYGTAEFSYVDGDITLLITYYGLYTYTIVDVAFTDDSFLTNVQNIYYYTEDGNKYLYFTYGENDDFLITDTDLKAKTWNGFVVWNLTTGEIVSTQRAWVLTYIDVEEDLSAYAYFYLPTIPTDDLMSVSVTYTYRLGQKGITTLWRQQYTDWSTKSVVLEQDVESIVSVPQWSIDLWTYSAPAMTIGAILSMVPGGQIVGFPLFLVGSVVSIVSGVGAMVEIAHTDISEIQKLNYPTQTLVNTINESFSDMTGLAINISEEPVYKLHLGTYTGVDVNYVEFDQDNFKYTEIVWVTEGTIYTVAEDYIDNDLVVDEDYVATRPDEAAPLNLMSMLMMPLITIFFIILAFRMKAFSNFKQLFLIVGLFFIVLLALGVL